MDDMTWKAAMSSEIFREYAKNEMTRIAQEEAAAKVEAAKPREPEADIASIMDQFKQFEKDVRSSPKKLAIFCALQRKFASDTDYAAKTSPQFVNAVMMLDLDAANMESNESS